MQYENDAVELVRTFMAKYLPPHQLPQKPTQMISFSMNGAGSPEAGRFVIEHGRTMVQQAEERGRYTTIATAYTLHTPFKLEIKNAPREDVKKAIRHHIFQIEAGELLEEMVPVIEKYFADESPVITAHDGEWTRREEEPAWYQEYSARFRGIGRGIKKHPLRDLPEYLNKGTFVPFPLRAGIPNGTYQSSNGVASAHADRSGVYTVENPLASEQIAELFSLRTGWHVVSRDGHKSSLQ